ncbi:PspC domain-containing protein [Clostridium sp. D2Q-14]|uniref:PspC domain-containing protein n=1 Tax=Anaeromonas gelatinilytica TaxID=2683194 RepID=UPI00193B3939|nr:PspC domain-containing protein [Anaeromonas gelatinilytica]MBS4535500.1 PspC domain-containing protein [Anaeromonas gelatinilytica]
MSKKLFKSSRDKKIDGVCGGVAEYLEVDPSIIRLIWAITVFVNGIGVFLYIIAAIILPRDVDVVGEREVYEEGDMNYSKEGKEDNSKLLGLILIGLGIFFVLRRFFFVFHSRYMWPLLLVGAGVFLILRGKGNNNEE